jgi:hypothetical protein
MAFEPDEQSHQGRVDPARRHFTRADGIDDLLDRGQRDDGTEALTQVSDPETK